ncbi:hypothetical protein [Pseudomonas sp. PS01300]|uniref:hypothetical protein n=1 Tax=Pseudomonas sp. PS01300 TaxID=2991436 RepID=UPI00249BBD71|nr:hypothetical protein [Pseudomonas sp. PS01300]
MLPADTTEVLDLGLGAIDQYPTDIRDGLGTLDFLRQFFLAGRADGLQLDEQVVTQVAELIFHRSSSVSLF